MNEKISKSHIASKNRFIASIILNAVLIVVGAIGIFIAIRMKGFGLFMMYTNLSNILAIIASLVYLIFGIRALKNKTLEIPAPVYTFRFLAAASLMVTFTVVLTGFLTGIGVESFAFAFLDDSAFALHLACPILSLITILIFEQPGKLSFRHIVISSLLTYVYTVISVILNVLKIWHGPYPFLYVYEQPIYMSVFWIVIINGGCMLIAFIILLIKNHQIRSHG